MWVEIDNNEFNVENMCIQYTTENKATVTFDIDLNKNAEYYNFFLNKYDSCKTFILQNNQFICKGCLIKILNIEFNEKIDITISCDSIENNISKQRDRKINKILEK